jgi:tRNA1Val (adenine37-N6)-methyltransferase
MKVTTDSCLFGAWCAEELQKFRTQSFKLLDVGTGTGLLSLMMAQKSSFKIDAIEMDTDAAKQAIENAAASPWHKQVAILHGDVLQWKPTTKYDVILSNPPFYEGDLKSYRLNKNIAHHSEGLRLENLLHFVRTYLTEEGLFFLLLPFKRWNDLEKYIAGCGLYLHKKIRVTPTPSHAPFRLMVSGSHINAEMVTGELCIKDDQQHYKKEFIALLKDYYLYL